MYLYCYLLGILKKYQSFGHPKFYQEMRLVLLALAAGRIAFMLMEQLK
jgi:hypothetical protein